MGFPVYLSVFGTFSMIFSFLKVHVDFVCSQLSANC